MVPGRRGCCAAKVAPPGAWGDIAGPAAGPMDPDYDYMTFPEVVASAVDDCSQARIKDPRQALAMAEVHDCFTPTELGLMEDLGFAPRGTAWKEVLAGTFRPRRRAQVLRPSDRRLRAPDALRGVAPAPWRGGGKPERPPRARAQGRPPPQPRRRTRAGRVPPRDRRARAARGQPGPAPGLG